MKQKHSSNKFIIEEIIPTDEQIDVLYNLLHKRKHTISHNSEIKFEKHKEFVLNHPYRAWFLLKLKSDVIGSFYINNDNHIGINIEDSNNKQSILEIINYVNLYWHPLEPIASVRGKNFAVNVPPSNIFLADCLEEHGAELAQSTFYLPKINKRASPSLTKIEHKTLKEENSYGSILITSSSAKVSLIESIRQGVSKISEKIKIIGGDISSEIVSTYFVDEFWEMPKISDINVKNFIAECKKKKISMIIPTRDGELEFFAENKDYFFDEGIYVMISDLESIRKCFDKIKFSKLDYSLMIQASADINDIRSDRYVVKERYGAGSQSIGINLNKQKAIKHSKILEKPIFQPFISGKELSIDAYIDRNKNIKGIIMRERVIVVNGESQVTEIVNNPDLEDSLKDVIKLLDLYGHIILQVIIDKDSKVHVVECNPRFGGASAISIKSGLDSFYWVYLESLGIDISDYIFTKINRRLRQIRFKKDIYI